MTIPRLYNWIDYTIWTVLLVGLTARLYLDIWPEDPILAKPFWVTVVDAAMLAIFAGFVIRRLILRPPTGPTV